MESTKIHKVIIIGGGPAGLTAAIYAGRAEMQPLVIEGFEPGGQLMITTKIENFPGFAEPVDARELMGNMRKQAESYGTSFISENATELDLSKQPYVVKVGEKEFQTKTIIIATGAKARWMGLESEQKMIGRGVSACATCDGPFFKDKEVIVVGGGDSAMEEANFLSKFASKVTVIHRREEFRASKVMVERTRENPKVEFLFNSVVEEVLGESEGKVTGVKLKDTKTSEITEFKCDGMFLAIGRIPNIELVKDKLKTDENNYIVTETDSSKTSVEGVFAAGDVQDYTFRQAITSAGSGCMAAIEVERFLNER
ncbi:thioredoxin-disulfide reductase [archaeon]|jgi:thioredoxin reductase (NADPH)|nr:thioredoxin-disulfide reductase [archaeon]MBT3450397.1 thioredoxin-disulfide reductase [archaeon]MBT6868625.1 thioredoxin-disulfide reductase [archaeon]MBT7193408.1 thioredoxin-disulfide reductase [archaeon]MBT7381422.1 thioredoxin-disulfide reductase [archaeon]